MQLHTGLYSRLVYTASPLPSLRFLRHWYSLQPRVHSASTLKKKRIGDATVSSNVLGGQEALRHLPHR